KAPRKFKIIIMNQPINQVIGQPLIPQNANANANILVNLSFDNYTADQKYENLVKGTDPFIKAQRTENQTILQFSTVIFSGSSF
ncbi:22087_t:CDS:1, partial [Dentiscutata erythropus]